MSEYSNSPEETGLADELESYIQYEAATTGQRFLNWLIDNIAIRFGLFFLTGRVIVQMLYSLSPDFIEPLLNEDNSFGIYALSYMISVFNYLIYYTISEQGFKGRTLGKLITGTKVIRTDLKELTFKDVLLRTLSRLVPFEVFSGFGTPWHDSWTNTTVVKTR
ncbi:MAG: RDD family protein [Chitinophagaceae bacterium]